jgi:hypothetical protein
LGPIASFPSPPAPCSAQGATLIQLRSEGKIGDEVMHRIERVLDL